jgi:hypothetical protein
MLTVRARARVMAEPSLGGSGGWTGCGRHRQVLDVAAGLKSRPPTPAKPGPSSALVGPVRGRRFVIETPLWQPPGLSVTLVSR